MAGPIDGPIDGEGSNSVLLLLSLLGRVEPVVRTGDVRVSIELVLRVRETDVHRANDRAMLEP